MMKKIKVKVNGVGGRAMNSNEFSSPEELLDLLETEIGASKEFDSQEDFSLTDEFDSQDEFSLTDEFNSPADLLNMMETECDCDCDCESCGEFGCEYDCDCDCESCGECGCYGDTELESISDSIDESIALGADVEDTFKKLAEKLAPSKVKEDYKSFKFETHQGTLEFVHKEDGSYEVIGTINPKGALEVVMENTVIKIADGNFTFDMK